MIVFTGGRCHSICVHIWGFITSVIYMGRWLCFKMPSELCDLKCVYMCVHGYALNCCPSIVVCTRWLFSSNLYAEVITDWFVCFVWLSCNCEQTLSCPSARAIHVTKSITR